MSNIDALVIYAVAGVEQVRMKARKWSQEEDTFLRENLGRMTDAQIGQALGRSAIGVHLRWFRDLQLSSPSKATGVITANQAAKMLGVDGHKIAHWMDAGFIPGRLMAGGRKIRLIEREAFQAWCMDTDHWMYFDIRRVTDADLKKMLREKARRWGDEWWPTPRVAKYHGMSSRDVLGYVTRGRLKATQIRYSYGGRHLNRKWSYWFVLKSEATRFMHYRKRRK